MNKVIQGNVISLEHWLEKYFSFFLMFFYFFFEWAGNEVKE